MEGNTSLELGNGAASTEPPSLERPSPLFPSLDWIFPPESENGPRIILIEGYKDDFARDTFIDLLQQRHPEACRKIEFGDEVRIYGIFEFKDIQMFKVSFLRDVVTRIAEMNALRLPTITRDRNTALPKVKFPDAQSFPPKIIVEDVDGHQQPFGDASRSSSCSLEGGRQEELTSYNGRQCSGSEKHAQTMSKQAAQPSTATPSADEHYDPDQSGYVGWHLEDLNREISPENIVVVTKTRTSNSAGSTSMKRDQEILGLSDNAGQTGEKKPLVPALPHMEESTKLVTKDRRTQQANPKAESESRLKSETAEPTNPVASFDSEMDIRMRPYESIKIMPDEAEAVDSKMKEAVTPNVVSETDAKVDLKQKAAVTSVATSTGSGEVDPAFANSKVGEAVTSDVPDRNFFGKAGTLEKILTKNQTHRMNQGERIRKILERNWGPEVKLTIIQAHDIFWGTKTLKAIEQGLSDIKGDTKIQDVLEAGSSIDGSKVASTSAHAKREEKAKDAKPICQTDDATVPATPKANSSKEEPLTQLRDMVAATSISAKGKEKVMGKDADSITRTDNAKLPEIPKAKSSKQGSLTELGDWIAAIFRTVKGKDKTKGVERSARNFDAEEHGKRVGMGPNIYESFDLAILDSLLNALGGILSRMEEGMQQLLGKLEPEQTHSPLVVECGMQHILAIIERMHMQLADEENKAKGPDAKANPEVYEVLGIGERIIRVLLGHIKAYMEARTDGRLEDARRELVAAIEACKWAPRAQREGSLSKDFEQLPNDPQDQQTPHAEDKQPFQPEQQQPRFTEGQQPPSYDKEQ